MTKPIGASTRMIIDAIDARIAQTGCSQKVIALDAGFPNQNYLSMLRAGERVGLARIPGLKRALPDLDEALLTATVFSEMFQSADAEQAIAGMVQFLSSQPRFEQELLDIAAEIRAEDEQAGLSIPDMLDAATRQTIKALLKGAVQRETTRVHMR